MKEAREIISLEGHKLNLNKAVLENILKPVQGLPIVILSVIGAYRTGKSFLLSWLVCYFKAHFMTPGWLEEYEKEESPISQFFKWRSGSKPETQGIWAWSEVFILKGPADKRIGVLLIDTQGLFDENSTLKQNGNIFTLSTLMSSIQIFNLSQKMQEDYLGNLELFSEFGRLALEKKNSNCLITKPFQRIVFLIRDWSNAEENPFGSKGGKDYINSFLDPTNKEGELRERRLHIRQCFDQIDCYLMPYPGPKVAGHVANGHFDGRLSDMDETFKDYLEKLPRFLIPDGLVQSKTVAGTRILGGDLADYIESCVNLLNTEENLSPQSMFQTMAKVRNDAVAKEAKNEYKKYVTCVEEEMKETFLTDVEIKMKHLDAQKKALKHFRQHQMGEEESNAGIWNDLNNEMNEEFDNWKTRNGLAKAEIQNSNGTAFKDAQKTYTSSIGDYLKEAKPPVSSKKLTKQHQKIQESVTNHLKSLLKGPNELYMPFIMQLQQFTEDYFLNVIVTKHEANEREEKARLEKIKLETEREKERLEKEEAQRKAEEAEAKREAAEMEVKLREAEAAKTEKDYELRLLLEAERSKLEQIRADNERDRRKAAEAEREKIEIEKDNLAREREEKDRLEKIRLKNERDRERAEKQKAKRRAEEEAQRKFELEKELQLEKAKKEYGAWGWLGSLFG